MSDLLDKPTVLILNRNWQAINVRTPADVFCQMAANTATGLDIDQGTMIPRTWEDWLSLEVRPTDTAVHTVRGPIRVPTVVVLARFDKVPKRRPKLSPKSIWQRDGGKCQYTGRPLKPGEGSIDHVIPRSRGGLTTWENCVLACREVNQKKGSKLPAEAGLKLLKQPKAPPTMPATILIRNVYQIEDWNLFLQR